jgi:hypothetical protein
LYFYNIKKQQTMAIRKFITAPTNQEPEIVAYISNNGRGGRGQYEMRAAVLEVGAGATSSYGMAGNDSYPHTIWGWEHRGNTLIVYVTNDKYQWEQEPGTKREERRGKYVFTSVPPTPEHPATGIEVTRRGMTNWHINGRSYYESEAHGWY